MLCSSPTGNAECEGTSAKVIPMPVSNRKTWAWLWLVLPAAAAINPGVANAGTTRPLYVFAPSSGDARLTQQQAINAAAAGGYRERDMTVTVVTGPSGLRSRFGISPGQFRVILVGKDGGVKLSSGSPVSAATLFALIDAMPMRRDEMRQRGRR